MLHATAAMTLGREERMPFTRTALVTAAFLLVPLAARAQANTIEREFEEGDFTVSIARDALTDANSSFILSMAESEEGALGWKCMEDGLNVVLAFGTYYEGDQDNDILVQYRFDETEPDPQEYWGLLSGKEMAFIRMAKVAPFTGRALDAKRIVVRAVDPYDNETRTFVFGVKGLEDALENLPCAGELAVR